MGAKDNLEKSNDSYLKECAKKLLSIKLGNNRSRNKMGRIFQDMSYEDPKEHSINFEYEKYLEELNKREFFLDKYFDQEKIDKDINKIRNIELIPIKDEVKREVPKNKDIKRSKDI